MDALPERSDIVIIGGVAAGPKTAATLARRLPNSRITLFQKEKYLSYATCGFPFFASGEINSFEDLLKTSWGVVRDTGFFEQAKGLRAVTSAEVTHIDRNKKSVTVKVLDTGETIEHGYDRLVIATGSTPNKPPMPVPESDRVRHFTRPDDVMQFRRLAQRGEIERVVIIGGGFIGVELCEAVKDMWGIEASLFEKQPQLLPFMLDPEMAAIVQRSLARDGVSVATGAEVEKIDLDSEGRPVVFVEGREPLAADYVFLCLGVHPETTLARDCGLDIGDTGGILVNGFLQTSDPDVFAGGDCIESTDFFVNRGVFMPMGSLANRHGRVIAENLAGSKTEFQGVVGAFVLRAFETNAGGVGLSEQTALREGFDARSVWGSFPDRPDYIPEVKTFTLKMIYEKGSNRLLGLQAVGRGDISRRIDVFSALLRNRARVDDLFDLEQCYAPPFAEALDPLHHMAGIATAVQRGARFIGPGQLRGDVQDALVLDVRETEEAEGEPPPQEVAELCEDTIRIPLGDLRHRLDELDRSRRIVIICRRGPRSYQAALILQAAGFEKVDILGAGLQAQW